MSNVAWNVVLTFLQLKPLYVANAQAVSALIHALCYNSRLQLVPDCLKWNGLADGVLVPKPLMRISLHAQTISTRELYKIHWTQRAFRTWKQ